MDFSKKTVAALTLGCKVNMYDTEAILELFTNSGYEIKDFKEYANVYIINTCTVTNFGDKKSRQMIRRAKKQNPESIVVATGCYSQVSPEEVSKIEGVNLVVGTKDRNKIVEIVEKYKADEGIINKVTDIKNEKNFENLSITNLKNKTRAFLKIQEGCNKFCSYCIIPYARGPIRSRKLEDTIEEVKRLSDNNFKEIVLAGIEVSSYGKDLENVNLINLVEKIHNIDGIERIRFSSVNPKLLDNNFIKSIKNLSKICNHFHISLQSGSDKILKSMNREYTKEEYYNCVLELRKNIKDVSISTDIIVGFPGETKEDFYETKELLKKINFSKVHVFPYSKKEGTKAYNFKDQISSKIKENRSKELISFSEIFQKEFINNFVDKEMEVLYEKKISKNFYEGYTKNYIRVKTFSKKNLENEIIKVKILKSEEDHAISINV